MLWKWMGLFAGCAAVAAGCGIAVSKSPSPSIPPSSRETASPVPLRSKSRPAPKISESQLAILFGAEIPAAPIPLPSVAVGPDKLALPVQNIPATYGATDSFAPLPKDVPMAVRPSQSAYLAYAVPLGGTRAIYVPAPPGMRSQAGVGADGSLALSLQHGSVSITISDTPACVGCAVDGAAGIFPAATRQSGQYGDPYSGPALSALRSLISYRFESSHLFIKAYQMRTGRDVWGLEDFNLRDEDRPGGILFMVSVSGPAQSRTLADTVLSDVYAQLDGAHG